MPRRPRDKSTSGHSLSPASAASPGKLLPAALAVTPPNSGDAAPTLLLALVPHPTAVTLPRKKVFPASASCPPPPNSLSVHSGDGQNNRAPAGTRSHFRSGQTAQYREMLPTVLARRRPQAPSLCIPRQISKILSTASPPCNTARANAETQSHHQYPCDSRCRYPTSCSQNLQVHRRKAAPPARTAKQKTRWPDAPDGALPGEIAWQSFSDHCRML